MQLSRAVMETALLLKRHTPRFYASIRNNAPRRLRSIMQNRSSPISSEGTGGATARAAAAGGAELKRTVLVRTQLPEFVQRHSVQSLLDAPCGDFHWMKYVHWPAGFRYLGADIVPDLIAENRRKYPDTEFIEFDVLRGVLPAVDAWLARDLMIHFPDEAIRLALNQFRQSTIRYLLAIDQLKFHEVIASHSSEGYNSYKYFDKQLWLRSKMMRVVELGLDKSAQSSVLDLGCGAGYFLYCCKYLGHSVHGVDLPDYEFYRDMIALFGISRTGFRIEAFKNLPLLNKRFDVITAHQICFNGHKTENLWGVDEWAYFLNDLEEHYLNPGGTIALEFNEEPEIGFYTKQLRRYFESRSARIFRGRVIISRDQPRSQLAPAAGSIVAA